MLAKGPMVLGDLWGLLVRFRSYLYALGADVSKAYYCMKTSLLEKHLRRVLWRYGDKEAEWKTFGFVAVSFGDRPAAALLDICIRMCIEMFGAIDHVAAKRMIKDHYVDDLATGGSKEEVQRFKGNEDENLQCDGTMTQILTQGGLKLKAVVVSGEQDGLALEKLGASVLGLGFSTQEDLLYVKFKANISKRRRGAPTGPDLKKEDLDQMEGSNLTMRMCLGVCNSQYDPLGLASPLIIRLKVGMKLLHRAKLAWDDSLPPELRELWMKLLAMVVEAGNLPFHRGTKPEEADGSPEIVLFWDGSDVVFSCAVYV